MAGTPLPPGRGDGGEGLSSSTLMSATTLVTATRPRHWCDGSMEVTGFAFHAVAAVFHSGA